MGISCMRVLANRERGVINKQWGNRDSTIRELVVFGVEILFCWGGEAILNWGHKENSRKERA